MRSITLDEQDAPWSFVDSDPGERRSSSIGCVATFRHDALRPIVPIGDSLVFVTADGLAINGSWFTKHFQALLRRADLPAMRLHDMRHGAASLLAARWIELPPSAGGRLALGTATLSVLGWDRATRCIESWNLACAPPG